MNYSIIEIAAAASLALAALLASEAVLARQSSSFAAQTPAARPAAPTTYEEFIVTTWKSIHDKILTMAKDTVFPDDKVGWKPHPDSRSMLEEYRHVTIGLEMSMAQITGEKFDYTARMAADDPPGPLGPRPRLRRELCGDNLHRGLADPDDERT
jgi:hypothetical protein